MFSLNCRGRLLVIDKPIVMGIINVTNDSFYEESRFNSTDAILSAAEKMLNEGATILDVGGQSTRPGSQRISSDEELKRIIQPIEQIHGRYPGAFISIDTFYSAVAKEAVAAGASIINDISAGSLDEEMIETVASLQVPYVLMHMKGDPQTMKDHAQYENVSLEVLDFFSRSCTKLKERGITDIIIDPGIGFAKTISHNFQLMKELEVFSILEKPLLLGISRKSFIYKTLDLPIEDALNGTTAMHMVGLMKGAAILRVHDVKEAMQVIELWTRVNSQ